MTRQRRNSTIAGVILFVLIVLGLLIGGPLYRVWSQEQRGRADLAEARFNRQVIVEEAQSNEALIALLGGDTERLIRFQLIDALEHSNTIYVPTEEGLPILEANRALPGQ